MNERTNERTNEWTGQVKINVGMYYMTWVFMVLNRLNPPVNLEVEFFWHEILSSFVIFTHL